jgi:hypothetical protein
LQDVGQAAHELQLPGERPVQHVPVLPDVEQAGHAPQSPDEVRSGDVAQAEHEPWLPDELRAWHELRSASTQWTDGVRSSARLECCALSRDEKPAAREP